MSKLYRLTIYFLAFLLPLQTHYLLRAGELNGQAWEFGKIALYGLDLLVIVIIFSQLINRTSQLKAISKFYRGMRWLLPTLIICTLPSLSQASDTALAWYSLSRLILGVVIFQIISKAHFNLELLKKIIIASATIQAIWGLVQFLSQSTFANKWLGLAVHLADTPGTSVIEVLGADGNLERWLRAYGALPHPNILGAFLALALILCLGIIIQKQDAELVKQTFDYQRVLLYLSLALLSAGIFVTFSRSAGLASIAGCLIVCLYNLKNIKKLLPSLAIILISIGLMWINYGYIYQSRFQSDVRLEQISTNERLSYLSQAQSLIASKTWTGVGTGQFGLASYENKLSSSQSAYDYQPVHNVFLLIASENGIIALVCFLIILAMISVSAIQPRFSGTQAGINAGLLSVLTILMFFDHLLWTQVSSIYLLWIYLGLITVSIKTENV